MRELIEHVAFALGAFVVAALPERVKLRQPWRSFSTTGAHLASGAVETGVSVVLFGVGMLSFLGAFSNRYGMPFVTGIPNPTTSDLGRLGILAFVSYLITPWGLATLFGVAEGILRALEAAFNSRHLGLAALSLPHWLGLAAVRRLQRAHLETMLGPPRPDRVETASATPDGTLRIICRDRKPWSEVQVVEFDEHFYILVDCALIVDGEVRSHRYRLRPLDPNEVIRGTIAQYPSSGA